MCVPSLSRACLGNMITFICRWLKRDVFRTDLPPAPRALLRTRRAVGAAAVTTLPAVRRQALARRAHADRTVGVQRPPLQRVVCVARRDDCVLWQLFGPTDAALCDGEEVVGTDTLRLHAELILVLLNTRTRTHTKPDAQTTGHLYKHVYTAMECNHLSH